MDAYKKFGGAYPQGSKVQELKDVLQGQKNNEEENLGNEPTDAGINVEDSSENKAQIEKLELELAKAKVDLKSAKEEVLRTVAEFDNTRKRLKKETEEMARFANEKLINEFLPIVDSLEMSLTHAGDGDGNAVVEGVKLTLKQFMATLEKFGLTSIEGEGDIFDPNSQEAIGTEQTNEFAEGCVARVHRKGYKLHGRVIRPAMVSVATPLLS